MRIQLKCTKGWRMPANTVKVDRTTRWGNPFRVGTPGVPDAATALTLFRAEVSRAMDSGAAPWNELRVALGGKNLACWCVLGAPCHADTLLELANNRLSRKGYLTYDMEPGHYQMHPNLEGAGAA